jgi:protein SCO1/2
MRYVIGPMLRILVVGLVLLVAIALWLPRPSMPPPEQATELPEPLPLPAFSLTSDAGRAFTPADLEQRFTLMFFGFTHCPDVCPLSLQVLAEAARSLRARIGESAPEVVLVSVDPDRDTPERLREYLDHFDSEFIGVTGPRASLDPLIGAFGVTVMRQELPGENYNMTHNPQVFVIGPEAALIAIMSKAENPELVASDFLRIRDRYRKNAVRPAAAR